MGRRPRTRPARLGRRRPAGGGPVGDRSNDVELPRAVTPAPAAARARDPATSNFPVTTADDGGRTAARRPPARDPATWNQLSTVRDERGRARAAHRDPRTSNWSTCSAAAGVDGAGPDRSSDVLAAARTRTRHRPRAARTAELAVISRRRSGQIQRGTAAVGPRPRGVDGCGRPVDAGPDRSSDVVAAPVVPLAAGADRGADRSNDDDRRRRAPVIDRGFGSPGAAGTTPNDAAGQWFSIRTNSPTASRVRSWVAGRMTGHELGDGRTCRPARGGSDDAGTSGRFASGRDRAPGSPGSSRPRTVRAITAEPRNPLRSH